MQARMTQPAVLLPDAMQALIDLSKATARAGLAHEIAALVELRASQLNGCSVCVEMHASDLRKLGAGDERIIGVTAWLDSPHFSPAERAALALTDAVTRLADPLDPVPDSVWDEAAKHFDERALAALLLTIGAINVWNRLNIATRQPAGEWTADAAAAASA